ncbi:MAG: SDR family NAD(P)-dependent oxidoreductase, partial [Bacteroidota bacterium]
PLSELNDVVTDTQSDATEVAEEITDAPLSEPNDVVTTATASIELVTDTIEAEIFSESEKNIQQLATTVALIDPTEATSRAQAYFVNGQIAEGLQMYQQAVEQHPDHTDLRYQYAVALLKQQNDFTAAKQQLEQLLTVDASNSAAHFKLAELAEMDSDMAMAKTHYEQVAALAPDYPQLDYRLGMVHLAQSNPQHLKAAQYFKQAIQKQSQMADAYYQLALLLKEHAQKPEKAVKFLQKTLQVNPEHAYAAYDLARLQHELGNTTEAAAAYAKAIVIDPDLRTSEQDQLYFSIAPTVDPQVLQDAQDEIAQLHALLTASEATIAEREAAILQRDATIAERDADVAERDNLIANKETTIAEQLAHINVLEKPAHPIKTVMITGATSGIGRATAELFAREGHRLILTGRRVERLRELEADFKNEYQHSQVQLLPFDVRDTQAIEEAMTQLTEEWQAIDILVNNAGLASGLAPIHEGELADWERMIDTNIKGLLYMTRAITPQMVARRQGHVINVGSIAGKQAYPNGNVYNATKFAVDGLTQAMRLDLYPYNVRVSQVAPGHVEETEFALVRFHGNEERAKIYEDFQPLKASDVAETIYFIATRPSHVNIQDVLLMGTQQGGATFIDRSGRNTPQE